MQAILLPLQMISGDLLPDSALPSWLAHVADAFPLAHLTDALQHAWLPTGATIAWGDLGVMALWAAGAAYVAARRFRWLPRGARLRLAGLVPAQGQHPDAAVPGRHGRADRAQRGRLLPRCRAGCRSAARRAGIRVPPVDYAQIPCEVTPGSSARGRRPPRRRTWLRCSRRCSCTARSLHLGGNMLFLWIFGNNVEDSMGRVGSSPSTCSAGSPRRRCRSRSTRTRRSRPRRVRARSPGCSAATSCCSRGRGWSR